MLRKRESRVSGSSRGSTPSRGSQARAASTTSELRLATSAGNGKSAAARERKRAAGRAPRASWGAWTGWTIGITVVVLSILLTAGLVFDVDLKRYVDLESVRVDGAAAVSDEEILRLAGLLPGQNLLQLDRERLARRLETDPRVRKANIRIDWFQGRVVLQIEERQPVALVSGVGLVDETGATWEVDRRAGRLDLPIVSGLERVSEEIRPAELAVAVRLLAKAAVAMYGRAVSELALTEEGPELYFEGGPGPVLFGYGRYEEKLERLARLLASQPGTERARMDLRWQGRVIVSGMMEARSGGRTDTAPPA